jgi:hypothetical protein
MYNPKIYEKNDDYCLITTTIVQLRSSVDDFACILEEEEEVPAA